MAVRDALAVNRHVFMTGHNDDHGGVRQAPVEFPMRVFPIRVSCRLHLQCVPWEGIFVLESEASAAFGLLD